MDKLTANKIIKLVETPDMAGAVNDYCSYRISHLLKSLEAAPDYNTVMKLQGQLVEIRKLEGLRNEILGLFKNGHK